MKAMAFRASTDMTEGGTSGAVYEKSCSFFSRRLFSWLKSDGAGWNRFVAALLYF